MPLLLRVREWFGKRSCLGKVGALAIGLFALLCMCISGHLAIGNVGQRIGIVPTWTPRPPTSTPGPTNTAAPTNTAEPTLAPAPSRTPVPTATPRPTRAPAPTNTPRPPGTGFRGGTDANPVYFGEGRSREVDPPWWPCAENQVKGNIDSGLYHTPTGSFYAKTFEGVRCFDTAQDAADAGFTESQR